jgi:excisionase family DNA binding protein
LDKLSALIGGNFSRMEVNQMDQILYTVPEVAKLLKTNQDYVHKLRKSGLLPFLKLGQYKCRKEALEKFLAEHEGQDVTDPENVRKL